tara:strand:- start:421 stop:699 length:279 start_codon:yes stop_codon:yes gene_type:complete
MLLALFGRYGLKAGELGGTAGGAAGDALGAAAGGELAGGELAGGELGDEDPLIRCASDLSSFGLLRLGMYWGLVGAGVGDAADVPTVAVRIE